MMIAIGGNDNASILSRPTPFFEHVQKTPSGHVSILLRVATQNTYLRATDGLENIDDQYISTDSGVKRCLDREILKK